MKNFFEKCFPENNLPLLSKLAPILGAYSAVMAGGTALALQIGHRRSIDLDFFTLKKFKNEKLIAGLSECADKFQVLSDEEGTLLAILNGVKISVFHYEHPFVMPTTDYKGLKLAHIADIAAMKVIAISQRGCRRDFVDLYCILQKLPFPRLVEVMVKKFGSNRFNAIHIGKSLVYFNDADLEPEIQYQPNKKLNWKTIKSYFVKHSPQMTRDLGIS